MSDRVKVSKLGVLGSRNRKSIMQVLPYGVALLSVASALGITLMLGSLMRPTPLQLFFLAVMVSAWYGGWRPGLFATVLSTLAANYFLIEPSHSLDIANLGSVFRLGTFVLAAIIVSWLNQSRQTALRKAEAALQSLRESEAKFGFLAESNLIGMVVSDLNGLVLEANDAFLKMVGYTEEELRSGRVNWHNLTPPEYQQASEQSVQELRSAGACAPFEKEYISKDGSRVPVLIGSVKANENTAVGYVLDLSDRKQVETALQQREAELRLVTDTVPALISFIDSDQRYRFNNRSYEEWWGYPATEIYGKHLREVLGATVYEAIRPYVEKVLAGERVTFETQVPYKGRESRYVSVTYVPRFNTQGTVEGFVVLVNDISDRKQAEEALRASESRLRLMMESAKEYAIFTMDLEGQITQWNAGAERLLGYCEPEIVAQHYRVLFTPEDIEQGMAEQEMQSALQKGVANDERWHQRKDSSLFWASGLVMPLLDESGQIQGLMKILRDMTAEKQASERLQLLYETASDLLSTEQPLALMNRLFSKVSVLMDVQVYFNYLVDDVQGRPMLRLDSYSGVSEEIAQTVQWIEFGQGMCGLVAQERRQIVVNDVPNSTCRNADSLCNFNLSAYAGQPLIVQGKLLGVFSFASFTRTHFTSEEADLLQATSDQIAVAMERANLMQSLRQQTEQLSQANRIKDEFLAVLSHELRTPLNPILGWSKLLRRKKHDEATVDRALETIERNAQLQTQLIDDLLDVSRILQGKFSLNASPVNLVFTIQAAMETVRLAAEAKAIQIQTTVEPDVGQVLGDANRLQQVIWNLLSNAVKFTPTGGRVSIQLKRHHNQAHLIVSDTGKGIPPEFLPYVFDSFRQADSGTTRKFGGLGLGLAIVRQIVELHGGRVFGESPSEGQGAIFTVKLPLLQLEASQTPGEPQTPCSASEGSALAGLRILVVDDEADSRDLIAFVLEQEQAKVVALASALEAVQELARYKPNVLVSDIGMPDMDGYMFVQHIRNLPPEQGGQIPAIALTAYAGEIDQQAAIAAGFQAHLSKPIEPATIIAEITRLCRPQEEA